MSDRLVQAELKESWEYAHLANRSNFTLPSQAVMPMIERAKLEREMEGRRIGEPFYIFQRQAGSKPIDKWPL